MSQTRSVFFRIKAERCRTMATAQLSPETVTTLLEMSRNFDRLADLAEQAEGASAGTGTDVPR